MQTNEIIGLAVAFCGGGGIGGAISAIVVRKLTNQDNKERRQTDELSKFRAELLEQNRQLRESWEKREEALIAREDKLREEAEARIEKLREEYERRESKMAVRHDAERAEWNQEKTALDLRLSSLEEKYDFVTQDLGAIRLAFATYRERVRIYIGYVKTNNPAANELATVLENDEHEVDRLLNARRVSVEF